MLRNNRGAALVEMALILPLLLLIVFGIFEFGRAMFIVNTLNNAAREGARRASVSPAPINVEAFVSESISFAHPGLNVSISNNNPTPGSGTAITVTATLPFQPVTAIVPFPENFTLSGQATMRYEM